MSVLEPARPRPRRVRKARRGLPLRLLRVPLIRPISTVEGPFFGSGRFYVRISAVGGVALLLLGILLLRLWSLQVIQGPRYEGLASRQTSRLVDLPAPRAPIVDAQGRLLAGTDGRLSLTADAARLGRVGRDGLWRPTASGRTLLARVSRVAGEPLPALVRHVRRSLTRDPFAPAALEVFCGVAFLEEDLHLPIAVNQRMRREPGQGLLLDRAGARHAVQRQRAGRGVDALHGFLKVTGAAARRPALRC